LDRVYEINRNFRNEGVSTQHNPEFTMLEFYQAYANYHDLMDLTEELIAFVANEVNGTTVLPSGEKDESGNPIPRLDPQGKPIDLAKKNWQHLTMREAIIKYWNPEMTKSPTLQSLSSRGDLLVWLREAEEAVFEPVAPPGQPSSNPFLVQFGSLSHIFQRLKSGRISFGNAIYELFEVFVEPFLIQPTIIYDYPTAVSPLSKQKPDDPDHVERFEIFAGGF